MEPGATQPSSAEPLPPKEPDPVIAAPPIDKDGLRDKVRELATVSGDLEMLTRQLVRPHSTIQVGLLHERMDQLTRTQKKLVKDIAAQCPDGSMRARFDALDKRLETLRTEVQETRDSAQLERYRAEIDPLVDEWAKLFQDMVVLTLQA